MLFSLLPPTSRLNRSPEVGHSWVSVAYVPVLHCDVHCSLIEGCCQYLAENEALLEIVDFYACLSQSLIGQLVSLGVLLTGDIRDSKALQLV